MKMFPFWTPNVCRICAQVSVVCVPIFEKDCSIGIDTKIRRCLSTNVSRDDMKPKQVCQDCVAKLNDFYNFVTLFHESNYRFENLLYTPQNAVSNAEYVDLDLSLTTKSEQLNSATDCSHLNVTEYKEDMIPLENLDVRDFNEQNIINEIVKQNDVGIEINSFTPNENNMLVEIASDNQNLEKITSYLDLGSMTGSENFIKMERTEPNYDSRIEDSEADLKKKNLISVQDICKEVERQQKIDGGENCAKLKFCRNRRIKNVQNCTGKTVKPSESVEDEVLLNDILNEVHLDVENFVSSNEAVTLKSKHQNLENSFSSNFDSATAEEKSLKKNSKLNVISVKTIRKGKEKPTAATNGKEDSLLVFECKECGKSFSRRQYLNKHVRKHDNVKPYICDICSKSFAVQWDLTFHKRIHTSSYSCTYCSKGFSAPSKLQRHVRIHTDERPFVCMVGDCRRSFSDKRNLKGHQLTHTNIRRFACEICKQRYKTNSQLKDHMRAHSDVPAFHCEICNKAYRWKTNLIIHMKSHNGFICSKCGEDCQKQYLYLKHRKQCTGNVS